MSKNIDAIYWILLTGFLAMGINTAARYLSIHFELHAFQLVFFYNILGLVFFLPFALKSKVGFKTTRKELYWLRAALEFSAFSLVFAALAYLPLPVHTALSFTSPLFGSIAAVLILKEPNSIHRWLALLVGFVGVLLIATSEGEGDNGFLYMLSHINIYTWYMLAGAVIFALCGVCIKKLTTTEPNMRITFNMLLMTAIIAAPFAVWKWAPIPNEAWGILLLLGILVAGVQYAVAQAFSKGDLTLLLPFFFLNLLWSALFGWLFFDEMLEPHTFVGAAIIMSASIYAAYMAKREGKTSHALKSDSSE